VAAALLIVDYQNDFNPGGALAVAGGDTLAAPINALASSGRFDLVVATRDWHPPHHTSFAERGGPWPVHCVRETPGADYHPALDRDPIDDEIFKGQVDGSDGYSGFEDTELERILTEHGVEAVTVVGLATDYCVKNTALDALRAGLAVTIAADAVRGVDVEPGDSERAFAELRAAGAVIS